MVSSGRSTRGNGSACRRDADRGARRSLGDDLEWLILARDVRQGSRRLDGAGHRIRVDAWEVEVQPAERVARAGKVVGRRYIERHQRRQGSVGTDRSRATIERCGGRGAVLLEDALQRGRHQRGLDLTGRPVRVCRLDEGRDARRVRARHRRALRWPGRAPRRACSGRRRPGSGVMPARICTPGAVTSGLRKSADRAAR